MLAARLLRVGLVFVGLPGFLLSAKPVLAACSVSSSCDGGESVTYRLSAGETASCTSGAEVGEYRLCCKDDEPGGTVDSLYGQRYSAQEHASSFFSQKNAVCGTAIETIPQCASCPGITICSGLEAVDTSTNNGKTDKFFSGLPNGEVSPQNFDTDGDGKFWFAGKEYDNQGIYFCNENNFACGNKTADSCIGNFKFGQPRRVGVTGGEGESRLWYPHLRLVSALSTLAQTLFNPFGLNKLYNKSAFSKNAPESNTSGSVDNEKAVVTKIEEHQGANDSTRVVNTSKNNSSVIVGEDAPPPLYSFENNTHDIYSESAACVLPKTNNNPGDDLLGPTITAQLAYTQKYEYDAYPKPEGCIGDGSLTDDPDNCCSAYSGFAATQETVCNPREHGDCYTAYRCATIPKIRMPTKGKTAIFIKLPLVEYIYDTLLTGKDALFAKFMPETIAKQDFEEIPSSSNFIADAIGYNQEKHPVTLVAGEGQAAMPTIYHPHIGSIAKYWLEDFQKALRPGGASFGSNPNTPPSSLEPNCDESAPAPSSANIPNIDRLIQIVNSGIGPPLYSEKNVRKCYNDLVNQSVAKGYDPAFVMAIWLEESGASNYSSFPTVADFGCTNNTPRANFQTQLSCFLNRRSAYKSVAFANCREKRETLTMKDFLLIYSEGFRACKPEDPQCYRQFCTNPQFPTRIEKYYQVITGNSLPNYP